MQTFCYYIGNKRFSPIEYKRFAYLYTYKRFAKVKRREREPASFLLLLLHSSPSSFFACARMMSMIAWIMLRESMKIIHASARTVKKQRDMVTPYAINICRYESESVFFGVTGLRQTCACKSFVFYRGKSFVLIQTTKSNKTVAGKSFARYKRLTQIFCPKKCRIYMRMRQSTEALGLSPQGLAHSLRRGTRSGAPPERRRGSAPYRASTGPEWTPDAPADAGSRKPFRRGS